MHDLLDDYGWLWMIRMIVADYGWLWMIMDDYSIQERGQMIIEDFVMKYGGINQMSLIDLLKMNFTSKIGRTPLAI